ncbi:putative E3 ubiquitin-protein ligase UBR7 [Oppia nitens]|uniref:putative E3 ubiquitin-protein ligase UBR7 n=1 Tax=Oppia nitens TaxID=1686743 RepID=UPI0023D9EB27|nr:putative E3 ubiquitin-protein ligase UBR7 [Oppia nitens]
MADNNDSLKMTTTTTAADDDNNAIVEDVADNDDGNDTETVTMLDVLQEEQDLEENAFAVLGGSDDKHCTYLKGYVNRQALYACKTCQLVATSDTDSEPRAAICLACSYQCHDGHELVELYTKRNYRCDCGNEKFAENRCKLYPKSGHNDLNRYNHNFDGLYCVCKRPYPDSDDDTDDQMIQCVVCEDWYHGRHLGNFVDNQEFAELICGHCMNQLSFLWYYNKTFSTDVILEKAETSKEIDVTTGGDNKPDIQTNDKPIDELPISQTSSSVDSGIESSCDSLADLSAKPNQCRLKKLMSDMKPKSAPTELSPNYWPMDWRRSLCKCPECLDLYKRKDCLFLIDEKDMVHYYENVAKESNTKVSDYDKGLSELGKMNRVQQIEIINGYNDLKNELTDYLKTFATAKRTVTEEDINEFFQQFTTRQKRQKVDMSYFCK